MRLLPPEELEKLKRDAAEDIEQRRQEDSHKSLVDQVMPIIRDYRDAFGREGVARALRFLVDREVLTVEQVSSIKRTIYNRLRKDPEAAEREAA